MKKLFGALVLAIGLVVAINTPSYAGNPLLGDSSGATVVGDNDLAKVKGSGYYSALYNYYGYYYLSYASLYGAYANYYNYNGSNSNAQYYNYYAYYYAYYASQYYYYAYYYQYSG
jgi:hypothetical protein